MITEARDAIRARVEEEWDATVCPVCWNKETFEPPEPPAPWIWIERDAIPASTSSKLGSVGKRVAQDPGLITATVYVPAHAGDDLAYALAEQFGEIFRVQRVGPAQTEAPSIGPVDDGDAHGLWTMVAVTIPFTISYFA